MAKLFYENRFILTKKLYRQYCSKTFVSMNKKMRILAFSLAAGFTAIALLILFLAKIKGLAIAIGVIALYFLYMGIWGYHYSEWLNFRRMQDEQGDKVLVNQLRFCADQVYVKFNQTSFTFKYSSITKAYETEDTLILIIGARGMIEHGQVVFKNGFTEKKEDTVEKFKSFINEKAKKLIFEETTENPEKLEKEPESESKS